MAPVVLITDPLDPGSIATLEAAGMQVRVETDADADALRRLAADADAWIIRSGTQITDALIAAAPRLRVIGRAGVGVDNVDLDAATRRGVLVLNAPDGNTLSTAEHTCAMMLALARHIPHGHASLAAGEWSRKQFSGIELYGKTLGVVGVGKIGRAVARRMQAFGMDVLGYDPLLGADAAARLGIRLVELDALVAESDVITLHTPLTPETSGLFGAERLARCKPGAMLVNCARGGIIDEEALLDALEGGHIGGAALDVYEQEPPPPERAALLRHPRVVVTPHLAASTAEAQEKVATQVVAQVIAALRGEPVSTPVNADALRAAGEPHARPLVALARMLGRLAQERATAHVDGVEVRCLGDVPDGYADVLATAALSGILSGLHEGVVNLVNARMLAEAHGLRVEVRQQAARPPFSLLVEVVLHTPEGARVVAGTVFADGAPRIVAIDEFDDIEIRPGTPLLIYRNEDRPGMLAHVGGLLAEAGINIASLALGRRAQGGEALTIVQVDEAVPSELLSRLGATAGLREVSFHTDLAE